MDLLTYIIKTLRKPFPEVEGKFGSLKIIAFISLFVFFVLYVFQPFGISTLESGKLKICLGFGITTFLTTVLYEYTIGRLFKHIGGLDNWTYGRWIINNIGIMYFISLANFLYARISLFGFIQWDLFPHMIYSTLMIGIIPLVVLGGFTLIKEEKKFKNIADEINQKNKSNPTTKLVEGKLIFNIPLYQIRFIEALQNYVKIGYISPEGQFIQQTERVTLKHISKEVEDSSIIKCHRSFLVNGKAIISTSGNAQGLLLTLSDCDTIIPVSRSYVSAFRDK